MDDSTQVKAPSNGGPEDVNREPWAIFARGAGEWTGRERMPAAAPASESTARLSARTVLAGRGLASDYVQQVGDTVTLTSHTLLWWDQASDRFRMHFASGAGGTVTVLEGRRDGERLIFEGAGASGGMRQTFDFGDGRLRVTSEGPEPEGGRWIVVFEGEYDRVDAVAGPEAPAPEPPAAPPVGSVGWRDLTVEDAEAIRDFYRSVVGWSAEDVSMGEYADYTMVAADGTPTAGVCHARGGNADLPPSWLVYVVVDDVAAAVREAEARGGAVVSPARTVGGARMAVIRDPAGAVLALYQPPEGG